MTVVWNEAVTQWKKQLQPGSRVEISTAKTICLLADRTEVKTFKDKALSRVAKWVFTMKILQDVEKFQQQGAPSRRYNTVTDAGRGERPVTRALVAFMEEVDPKPSVRDPVSERRQEYQKYRRWWEDGQIWLALSNEVGAGVLLLIPADLRAREGQLMSNKQSDPASSKEDSR